MRLNFNGSDPCQGEGILGVNKTSESSLSPSIVRLALAIKHDGKQENILNENIKDRVKVT